MPKYPGRIVSATPPSVSLSGASGVWTLEEVAQYEQAGTWPVGVAGADPYFNQTVLLLHGDGTNGAQNNTFLDSSSNNFTITRNGNTTQGTFSPFSVGAGEWSNYFDGSGDFLSIPSTSALAFGTGDFTVEAWVYLTATPSAQYAQILGRTEYGLNADWMFQITNSRTLTFYMQLSFVATSTGTIPLNSWTHVAVTRSGSSIRLFINGTIDGTATNGNSTEQGSSGVYTIGSDQGGDEANLTGYLSNVRAIKGTAVYTSNFTPSTAPLTAISGTSLLTCQSNRFVDNSTNAFAITRNGDVRVTPFSPFAPSAAYSPSVNGGSGYFDGTSDWLNVGPLGDTAFNFGTGAFTIEGWIYPLAALSASTYSAICSVHDGVTTTSWGVYARSNGIFMYGAGNIFVGGGTINPNTFTHFAVTRSGNTVTVYVNGEQVAQNTGITGAYDNSGDQLKIGDDDGSAATWNGYIASLRIIKGQALTTGAFTPPTAPVTTSAVGWTGANAAASITGTVSLLLNFTNAGIFDQTGKNNLETVGNAQVDTSVKKFGTGSMEFDGTGDGLSIRTTPEFIYGTGDFTIECWVYLNTTGVFGIFGHGDGTAANLYLYINTATPTVFFNNTGVATGPALSTGAWTHLAVTRSGTTMRVFTNGVSGTSVTNSTNLTAGGPLTVGMSSAATQVLNGYIDDLRITKGVARYPTEPFPTAPFPDF